MKYLNPTTVELTDSETRAHAYFNDCLDRGYDIPNAVRKTRRYFSNEEPAFYEWLAE